MDVQVRNCFFFLTLLQNEETGSNMNIEYIIEIVSMQNMHRLNSINTPISHAACRGPIYGQTDGSCDPKNDGDDWHERPSPNGGSQCFRNVNLCEMLTIVYYCDQDPSYN